TWAVQRQPGMRGRSDASHRRGAERMDAVALLHRAQVVGLRIEPMGEKLLVRGPKRLRRSEMDALIACGLLEGTRRPAGSWRLSGCAPSVSRHQPNWRTPMVTRNGEMVTCHSPLRKSRPRLARIGDRELNRSQPFKTDLLKLPRKRHRTGTQCP